MQPATYKENGVSGGYGEYVCTGNNSWTRTLHWTFYCVHSVESSHWVQVGQGRLLSITSIQQNWSITALQDVKFTHTHTHTYKKLLTTFSLLIFIVSKFETHIHKAIMEMKPNQRRSHSGLGLDGILNLLSHDLQKLWAGFIIETSGELGSHTQTCHQKADQEQTWVATQLFWTTSLHLCYQWKTLINLLVLLQNTTLDFNL